MIAKQMRKIAELESNVRGLQSQLEKERQRAEKKDQKAELYSKQLRSEGLPVLDASVDNSGRNHGDGGAFGGAPLGSSSPGTPGTMQARGSVLCWRGQQTAASSSTNNCPASFNAG